MCRYVCVCLCVCMLCMYVFQLPQQPSAMATATCRQCDALLKWEEKRRKESEDRLPPFLPRQTWCSYWAVTRTRHTYCLPSTDAKAKPHPLISLHKNTTTISHSVSPLLQRSLTFYHLYVNFSPGCHLATQSSISQSVCGTYRINGLASEQVLILLQHSMVTNYTVTQ